jgi:hypothetical protein
VGGRLGIASWAHLLVEATTELAMVYRQDFCVSAPVFLPPTGTFESTSYQYAPWIQGYPFIQSGLRMSAWARVQPSDELRVHVELGRAWGKRLWVPGYGASYLIGTGRIRGMLEYDELRYAVPATRVLRRYQDGVLANTEESERTFRSRARRFRIGANVGLRH